MLVLPLILIFFAAFRDLEGAICNKVCMKTTNCIRKLDDYNNLICDDIVGSAQVKCSLECNGKEELTDMVDDDDFREDGMYKVLEKYGDLYKNLWNENSDFMGKIFRFVKPVIKDVAKNLKLFYDLTKDTLEKRRTKRETGLIEKKRVKRTFGGLGGGGYGGVGGGLGGGVGAGGGVGGHAGGAIGGSIGGGIGGGIGPGGIYGGVNGGVSGFASGDVGAGIYGHGNLYGQGNAYANGGLYGNGYGGFVPPPPPPPPYMYGRK